MYKLLYKKLFKTVIDWKVYRNFRNVNGNIDIDIEHNNCKSQILQSYFKSSKNSLTSLLILLPLSKSFVLPFVHTFYPIKMHVEKFQTYIWKGNTLFLKWIDRISIANRCVMDTTQLVSLEYNVHNHFKANYFFHIKGT